MLAYAAHTSTPARKTGSPKGLVLIIAGHAVLIAAVMTAKMDLAPGASRTITEIFNVPIVPPPPPPPTTVVKQQAHRQATQQSFIDDKTTIVNMGQSSQTQVDHGTDVRDIFPVSGSGDLIAIDPPKHDPVKVAARFNTPGSALRPPYPLDMRRIEEEATLKLRLTIDTRGRVTAVDPVGAANPSFLEAARRHIIRAWRYKPATEDGVAVPSSTVITLSFRLEDA